LYPHHGMLSRSCRRCLNSVPRPKAAPAEHSPPARQHAARGGATLTCTNRLCTTGPFYPQLVELQRLRRPRAYKRQLSGSGVQRPSGRHGSPATASGTALPPLNLPADPSLRLPGDDGDGDDGPSGEREGQRGPHATIQDRHHSHFITDPR
jgi:hypothetical protein